MFPIIYCPFLFRCRRSWLRWDLMFIFLWLMKSILWLLHLISKHWLTLLAFLWNLSPRGRIPETAIWWLFSFTDQANELISLAISSGELTDLRQLVPVCKITMSGFFQSQACIMFHGFSASSWKWLHKNCVITASFICNRFSIQMFCYWISNFNCARPFLGRVLGWLWSIISSLSDFLSAWSRGSFCLVLLLEFLFIWTLSQERGEREGNSLYDTMRGQSHMGVRQFQRGQSYPRGHYGIVPSDKSH